MLRQSWVKLTIGIALGLGLVSCAGMEKGRPVPASIPRTLLSGTDTGSWRAYGKEEFPANDWLVEGDTLQCVGGGESVDLCSVAMFRDFEFAFEFKVADKANSGVIYRSSLSGGASWQTGPEYQVLDDAGHGVSDPSTGVAGLYALYEPQDKALRPAGEWNEGRLIVVGNRVEHWLNGKCVVKAEMHSDDWYRRVDASKFGKMPLFGTVEEGHIVLQDHGNDVWYRKLVVFERSMEEEQGLEKIALFDGSNTDHWSVHTRDAGESSVAESDTWKIEDGILVCSGQPAGYIFTNEDYVNYILELDWRWSPETKKAGNSGVLLRRVGEHKVWPKSFEAQLYSEHAGDFYSIGGFPMKTAPDRTKGRHTAHTHANENPVGEWNHYRIVVNAGKVTLEVNGQIVNEAWRVEEVPGQIALQSEGQEIHFKDVRLTLLSGNE